MNRRKFLQLVLAGSACPLIPSSVVKASLSLSEADYRVELRRQLDEVYRMLARETQTVLDDFCREMYMKMNSGKYFPEALS